MVNVGNSATDGGGMMVGWWIMMGVSRRAGILLRCMRHLRRDHTHGAIIHHNPRD